MNTFAIIIACGKEEEISPGVETAFVSLGNRPVLACSLQGFQEASKVDAVFLIVGKDRIDAAIQIIRRYGFTKVKGIVAGGANRLGSLRTALSKIKETPGCIVLHEASRPFVTPEIIDETVKAAKRYGCSIAAHKIPDAVKMTSKGLKVETTAERSTAWSAQTPQAFKADVLKKILDPKNVNLKLVDDESEFAIKFKADVHLIEAGAKNIKIRTSEDLSIATALFNDGTAH